MNCVCVLMCVSMCVSICVHKQRYVSVAISALGALGSPGSCDRRAPACTALRAMAAASPEALSRVQAVTPAEMLIAARAAADNSWRVCKHAADVAWKAEQTAMHARAVAREARVNSNWMEVLAAAAGASAAEAAATAHAENFVRVIRPRGREQPNKSRSRSRSRA